MPTLITLADFRRGARTNPAWQKASQGAALDMVNIGVDGQGLPMARMGYVVDDAVEVDGLGDQLVRVHDLGNSFRESTTRTFRLFSYQDYAVHKGRMFITGGGQTDNKWINLRSAAGSLSESENPVGFSGLLDAPTYTRTPTTPLASIVDDDDKYRPGGRALSNWFAFAYTFESIEFGFETPLSYANPFDFPTYSGGFFNSDYDWEVFIPHQNIPAWVDRINFYMQKETGVSNPFANSEFNPNGTGITYVKFGGIRFITQNQRDNFDVTDNPITLPFPFFEWHEGDTNQVPFIDDSITADISVLNTSISFNDNRLWPDGRGQYWRAVPTITGFSGVESQVLETTEIFDGTNIGAKIHPIMLYAERLWGWDREEQLLRFSKLGQYDSFPSDFAVELSASGQSHVEALVPAPTVSAFFVFKQDAIHVIRGSGVVDGLRMKSIADTDLDASGVMLQHGTLSPRTIISGDNGIYFISRDLKLKYLTIDGFGNTNVKDVGIAIDDYLAELTVSEQKDLIAFLYDNCYHIIMPGYVLVLDIQKRYWTRLTWDLKDAFWSEGGAQGESILYGIRSHDSFGRFTNDIVRLYEGFDDGGSLIPCEWESQDLQLPYETNVTGLIVQHTSDQQELSFDLYMDDVLIKEFRGTPQKGNHFRIGCYGYGHRARIRLKSDEGIPLISLLAIEIP